MSAVDPPTGSWPTLIRWTRAAVPVIVLGAVALLASVVSAHPTAVTSGSAQVRSCTAVAKLALDPAYSAAAQGYVVEAVTVRAGTGCARMTFQLTLSAGSRILVQTIGQLDRDGSAVAGLRSANIAASSVTNIGLTLTNAPPVPRGGSSV